MVFLFVLRCLKSSWSTPTKSKYLLGREASLHIQLGIPTINSFLRRQKLNYERVHEWLIFEGAELVVEIAVGKTPSTFIHHTHSQKEVRM